MNDLLNYHSDTNQKGQVECFGMTFPSEDMRREYFLGLLAEKLKETAFRNQEGFPQGTDDAILAMSDPPYYTACPNPWLKEFIEEWHGKKKRPFSPTASRLEPFAADVSEGKNDPVYNAHSYHTKVPHKAIQQFIEHFTQPGDIVFDGFAGTGMTGVAAQVSGRRAVLCDLSPAATFLASNFCTLVKSEDFHFQARKVKKKVLKDLDALYAIGDRLREFTIYSAVVECSNCQHQFDQWTASFDTESRSVSADFSCPSCGIDIASKTLRHARTQVYDPLLKNTIESKKRIQRFVKLNGGHAPDQWMQEDGNSYAEYEKEILSAGVPVIQLPKMYESHFKRNLAAEGVSHFHHFYSPRNLLACQKLWNALQGESALFRFAFLNTSWHATVMRRYNAGGGHRPKTNTLYVPALSSEGRVSKIYNKKLDDIERFLAAKRDAKGHCAISTTSASDVRSIPDNSIDYVFVDPPFGSNIMYSDLNFLWESWLPGEDDHRFCVSPTISSQCRIEGGPAVIRRIGRDGLQITPPSPPTIKPWRMFISDFVGWKRSMTRSRSGLVSSVLFPRVGRRAPGRRWLRRPSASPQEAVTSNRVGMRRSSVVNLDDRAEETCIWRRRLDKWCLRRWQVGLWVRT